MAGRCSNSSKAVAVAMAAAALLALLLAAGEAQETCNVDRNALLAQCASCATSGTPSPGCCKVLSNADFRCICTNYWDKLKNMGYAKCATAIPSTCKLPQAKCH